MARVLCTTPLQPGAAEALRGHHVEIGPPGSDPAAAALICTPVEPVSAAAIAAIPSTVGLALNSTPPPPFTCTSMKPGAK